jgi:rod shape-determining protein MreD
LQDFLLHRPPGLFSGISVMILILIKAITASSDDKSFLAEWVRVSLAFAAISLIYHLVLTLSFVNTSQLRISLIQTIFNISIYPFIVLVSHYIFRVKRPYFTRSGRVI